MPKNSLHHDPMATANALAATGGVLYVVCALMFQFTRPTYFMMMRSWAHGINWQQIPMANNVASGSLVTGFITFVIAAWLSGYLFAWFYNRFAK